MTSTLETLAAAPRWVCWRIEMRQDLPTKVPLNPRTGKYAKANDPRTWGTRPEAEAGFAKFINGHVGGIGINLGAVDNQYTLCGIDLDTCLSPDHQLAQWAQRVLAVLPSYTEISPSGTGLKAYFYIASADVRGFLDLIGVQKTQWGTRRSVGGGAPQRHAPAVEIYASHRYFAVSAQQWPGQPEDIRFFDRDSLQRLVPVIPPATSGGGDTDRSKIAFRIARDVRRRGGSYADFKARVSADPRTAAWVIEKGLPNNERELRRAWDNAGRGLEQPADGISDLIVDQRGVVLALESNAMTLMRSHPDVVGLFGTDEFQQRPNMLRTPPWPCPDRQFPRPVRDADLSDLLAWLQQQGVYLRGRAPVRMALASVVRDRTFHPVRDFLDSLKWDEQPRLDNLLTYYLGVEPIANYTSEVGRWWMISAVARIYRPGCIAKYVLVIEGDQDLGKSTALRILGGDWFTDDIATLGSKDSQMQVGNAWIIELAELDSTRRADINAIKAFISRPVDKFRPPYGEHLIEQQRQSILAATVNPAGAYLHDETGAVRFWPVAAVKIDLDALQHDRNQLWAEAVAKYKNGENWWPDDTFKPLAEQEARSETAETDPWFDPIVEWIDRRNALIAAYEKTEVRDKNGNVIHTYSEEEYKNNLKAADRLRVFSTTDVLTGALEIPKERMDRKAENRTGRILRHRGFVSGGARIDDGPPVRRWRRRL